MFSQLDRCAKQQKHSGRRLVEILLRSDLGNWRDEQQEFSFFNGLNALDLQHEVLKVPAAVICPTVCLELWPASPGKTTDV